MKALRVRRTDWSGRGEVCLLAGHRVLSFSSQWDPTRGEIEATLI
jgi:hypothetical protein